MNRAVISWVVLLLIVGVFAGCGGSKPAKTLNVILGRVAFSDNKSDIAALNGAMIHFHSEDGDSDGANVWGKLNDEGTFSVFTGENEDRIVGAAKGSYKVTITEAKNRENQVISTKYAKPTTTELSFDVETGNNTALFYVKPKS